ncbi:MAG: GGDEF domain-containing protein [Lachnospiraceae bacterium]|nr:GGDEF domain-containing protein [Lachnospiraceae bacterium]
MFDFFSGLREDNRLYDSRKLRAVINRLNMGRLYTFSLFGGVGMLLFAVLFSVTGFHMLPGGYQTLAFVSFSIILFIFFFSAFMIVKRKLTSYFGQFCYAYTGVIMTVMLTFMFRASNSIASMAFYMLLMIFLCLVPVFIPIASLIVWGSQFLVMAIFTMVKDLDSTTSMSFILIGIMGLMLSLFSYAGVLRKLDYKLSLDHAITEAETDPMTGLLNRRGLDRRLENVWPLCIRQQIKVAVLMVDIDNFKKYNDSFGHPAGDECIKAVTGTIRSCVRRRTDYAARVGGEEFLVLLTDIEPAQAVKWALNLQKAIADLKIPHSPNNFSPIVTISLGLSTETVRETTSFDLLKEEADKSLYDSKQNGRNRLYYRGKCYRSNRASKSEELLEEAN